MIDDTEILERKPWLKALVDYVLKRIELIIVTAALSYAASCNHSNHADLKAFTEQHLHDKQIQIDQFKETK